MRDAGLKDCVTSNKVVCSGLESMRKNHRSPECSFLALSQLLHCDVTEICLEHYPSYHKYEEMNNNMTLYIFTQAGLRIKQQKRRRILIRIRSMPNYSNNIV